MYGYGYGRKASEIVAYSYNTMTFCPEHLIERMIEKRIAAPAARDMNVEEVLDQIAEAEGIDRQDERSFDSNDFPKIIFSSDLEDDERCDWNDHLID
jgi:hypothetical protein